jgi:hypothetical protein
MTARDGILRAALVIVAFLCFADIVRAQAPPMRQIDTWSGLIVLCKVDAELNMPTDLCNQINAEAARQATAAKVKFVALSPDDGESGKIAKAKSAGFDDATSIEVLVHLRTSTSTTVIAALDIDALSRLHPVPMQVSGKPATFQKVYMQGGVFSRDDHNWSRQVMPMLKIMLGGFFEMYQRPAPKR